MATFSYQALPHTYGPWNSIFYHSGINTFTITYSALGDSQVVGKVKYIGEDGSEKEQEFYDSITFTTGNVISNIHVQFKSTSPLGVAIQGEISG